MPSKLKRAIAAVKDQTSISLAKVKIANTDSSNLEVSILKATSHDEIPIDQRHVLDILHYVSSNKSYAAICARAIGRRIGRTRNWVVAVKSLMLILRIFQDGDPYFPKEVLHAMKRGYKILNLSSFRDDSSTSCPWDFTAFVRTLALYLDERLDCFLTGKLQRRMATYRSANSVSASSSPWTDNNSNSNMTLSSKRTSNNEPIRDMKPGMLLDRISFWQRLLDRAIATRPTGAAKTNPLVHHCLYAIVQETFDLYRDISDGLTLLLDSFFHLQYKSCVAAFQTCVKASKQFEELCSFYDLCKAIGVGRTSEYPSVQKISNELIETLQEFLKDQSSFPTSNGRTPASHLLLPPPSAATSKEDGESSQQQHQGAVERSSERNSDYGGSQCPSLEDLISADAGSISTPTRSYRSIDPERYSDPGDNKSHLEDFLSMNDSVSVRSEPNDQRSTSIPDLLLLLDDVLPQPPVQKIEEKHQVIREEHNSLGNNYVAAQPQGSSSEGWEVVLFDSTTQSSTQANHNSNAAMAIGDGISSTTAQEDLFASLSDNIGTGFSADGFGSGHSNIINTTKGFEADSFHGFTSAVPSMLPPPPSPSHYNPFLQDTPEVMATSPVMECDAGGSSSTAANNYSLSTFGDNTMSMNGQASHVNNFSATFPDLGINSFAGDVNFSDGFPDLGIDNDTGTSSAAREDHFAGFDSNRGNEILAAASGSDGGNNAKASSAALQPISAHYKNNAHGPTGFTLDFCCCDGNANGLEPAAFPAPDYFGNGGGNFPPSFGAGIEHGDNSTTSTALVPVGFDFHKTNNNSGKSLTFHSYFGKYNGNSSSNGNIVPTFNANLEEENTVVPPAAIGADDFFSAIPSFKASPTFQATNPGIEQQSLQSDTDLFGSSNEQMVKKGPIEQQSLLQQQQMWLQIQNKIIAKNLS